jgi:hypothetical protein
VPTIFLLMYKLVLLPAPQNELLSPGQRNEHSEFVTFFAGVAPVFPAQFSVLPHQHSLPYCTPL